jgi:hypothetical protein
MDYDLLRRFMNKTLVLIITLLAFVLICPISLSSEEIMNNNDYKITISTEKNFLSINEEFTINGSSNETLESFTVWVQTGAYDINILFNSNIPDSKMEDGNEHIYNISSLGILKEETTIIKLTYKIEKDTIFTKKILRDTDSISIKFNSDELLKQTSIAKDTRFQLKLYQPTEPTLDLYIIVLIVLLVVIVILLTLYTLRKPKKVKITDTTGASEEFLTTKKALLMSILKDIEKQHRSKQISDDTYNKLKEKFKQEAVEAMKQLEDIKSKVK